MNQYVQSGMACILAFAFTVSGLATWVGSAYSSPEAAADIQEEDFERVDFVEGWYVVPGVLHNTGNFKSRTLPDIPSANEPVELQVHLTSHLKVTGLRVFARTRSRDPYGGSSRSSDYGDWFELCPQSTGQWSEPSSDESFADANQPRGAIWNTEILYSQQIEMPAGPHDFQFRVVPTSDRQWLTVPKTVPGWAVWIDP